MGIENNPDWNFKDLEEMMGSIKALTRNNEESKGIFIGPSMAPHFLLITRTPFVVAFMNLHRQGCRLQAQIFAAWMASRPSTVTDDARHSGDQGPDCDRSFKAARSKYI